MPSLVPRGVRATLPGCGGQVRGRERKSADPHRVVGGPLWPTGPLATKGRTHPRRADTHGLGTMVRLVGHVANPAKGSATRSLDGDHLDATNDPRSGHETRRCAGMGPDLDRILETSRPDPPKRRGAGGRVARIRVAPTAPRIFRVDTRATCAGFTPRSSARASGSGAIGIAGSVVTQCLSRRGHRSLSHFTLVRSERGEDLILLAWRDPEMVERAPQLGRDLIELHGGDVQVAMCLF
jgi:hypothetical protein